MKSSLQLKQGLSHTLHFELQQAIELLSLPSIELRLHVQSIVESNPMLELEENQQDNFIHVEYLSTHNTALDIEDIKPYTIKAYLFWQLALCRWPEGEIIIGAYVIEAMNDEGELELPLTEIQASLPAQHKSSLSNIINILRRIQEFDKTLPTHYQTPEQTIAIPDLMVQKENGAFEVMLNMDFMPHLKLVSDYSTPISHSRTKQDKQFIHHALKEARWLLKALQTRHHHLLSMARHIMQHQFAFLERGVPALNPLHYHELATQMGVHESTISRLVSHKLILTPQGLFELKYFFGNGTQPMQAMMKKLFTEEYRLNPLSDSQMTQLLLKSGFKATRRTVAKYRRAMAIPSSYQRRGTSYGNSNHRA